MTRARVLPMLVLFGLLLVLANLGRLFRPLDRSQPAPEVDLDGKLRVRPGTLGKPRHVKQLLVMVLVVAVSVLGTMVTQLAAAGSDGPLLWVGVVGLLSFCVAVPGVNLWISFDTEVTECSS